MKFKVKFKYLALILVLVVLGLASYPISRILYMINVYKMDLAWAIDAGLQDKATIWAPDFSNKKFISISVGMNTNQVVQILGKPLVRIDIENHFAFSTCNILTHEFYECWFYTTDGRGNPGGLGLAEEPFPTHGRMVIFDENMRVAGTHMNFESANPHMNFESANRD